MLNPKELAIQKFQDALTRGEADLMKPDAAPVEVASKIHSEINDIAEHHWPIRQDGRFLSDILTGLCYEAASGLNKDHWLFDDKSRKEYSALDYVPFAEKVFFELESSSEQRTAEEKRAILKSAIHEIDLAFQKGGVPFVLKHSSLSAEQKKQFVDAWTDVQADNAPKQANDN